MPQPAPPPTADVPGATYPPATPGSAFLPPATSVPQPWERVAVDVPGVEFEARPPERYAFDFPDSECDGWSTDDLALRFASVRGTNHRYYRRPRQDAARAAAHERTGSVVFAVADGVSSATESHHGAIAVCRASVERILDLLDQVPGPLDLAAVAPYAAARLGELARWRLGTAGPGTEEVARLFATTLVAGAVRPTADGPRVELFRVGDSGAWLLDRASGHYRQVFASKTGTDAVLVSNEVAPLPWIPDSLEQAAFRLPDHMVLLTGTDGFGDPLGDGDGAVGALFARHLYEPPPPLWLGHVLDFSRETFDDDRTLLAVWPQAAAVPPRKAGSR
ncbi:protein phosphatase 2C domain-containing protein [Streptomyces sp. NPDC127190]|uniref:protein phosphatase 2C domain-containing protein n=1 Tax=unclassified Streptomyces TaxID=2593676 RepID=UPI003633A52C